MGDRHRSRTTKKGAALLTLTERVTRQEHILKIGEKTAEAVNQGITKLKTIYGDQFPVVFKTITSDNGSEFSDLVNAAAYDPYL